jgi:hypothetical protein
MRAAILIAAKHQESLRVDSFSQPRRQPRDQRAFQPLPLS